MATAARTPLDVLSSTGLLHSVKPSTLERLAAASSVRTLRRDMVGELGVLDDVARSTSVAALRTSDVVEVPGRAFRDAFESDPAIARRLVGLLSARLRTSNDGFTDLASLDLGGRLAKYLLGEMDRQGHDRLRLPLTQTELGQLLGGARQTVNQVMQALERSDLVQVTGRTVHVLDAGGLRRRASGV